jgi:trk system potassium uptake protein TrkA
MAEFSLPEGSPVAGQSVREADRFESLTFAAVLRDDDVVVPRGDTVLRAGEEVVVIGSPESVRLFATAVAPDVVGARDVMIVGGSSVGFHTAELLETRGLSPQLIEQDPQRARSLAEQLPRTSVLENDATDRDFLTREHIEEVDVVIATLDSDQTNLLAALLADRLGADRSIAVVEDGKYVDLFEAVGIDVAINPREVTAEEITRFTREYQAEKVAMIEADRAEVLELEITGEHALGGRPIREAAGELPAGVVIGAITRDGAFVVPRGDTVVEPGDHVVVFAEMSVIDDATNLL